MYLTLAEGARTASWEQLIGYKENAAELVSADPLGLYSARFIGVIMRFATGVDMAWLSQISGIGVERLLWPFAFAMGIATASAAWALARIVGLPALIAALATTAIALGFWGAMPREGDAYSNLQSMPLLLGLVALRVWDAKLERSSAVLAIGVGAILAAFVQAYTELAILAVGILAAEAVARLALLRARLAALSSLEFLLAPPLPCCSQPVSWVI